MAQDVRYMHSPYSFTGMVPSAAEAVEHQYGSVMPVLATPEAVMSHYLPEVQKSTHDRDYPAAPSFNDFSDAASDNYTLPGGRMSIADFASHAGSRHSSLTFPASASGPVSQQHLQQLPHHLYLLQQHQNALRLFHARGPSQGTLPVAGVAPGAEQGQTPSLMFPGSYSDNQVTGYPPREDNNEPTTTTSSYNDFLKRRISAYFASIRTAQSAEVVASSPPVVPTVGPTAGETMTTTAFPPSPPQVRIPASAMDMGTAATLAVHPYAQSYPNDAHVSNTRPPAQYPPHTTIPVGFESHPTPLSAASGGAVPSLPEAFNYPPSLHSTASSPPPPPPPPAPVVTVIRSQFPGHPGSQPFVVVSASHQPTPTDPTASQLPLPNSPPSIRSHQPPLIASPLRTSPPPLPPKGVPTVGFLRLGEQASMATPPPIPLPTSQHSQHHQLIVTDGLVRTGSLILSRANSGSGGGYDAEGFGPEEGEEDDGQPPSTPAHSRPFRPAGAGSGSRLSNHPAPNLGTPCTHSASWKRLRAKRGYSHFLCQVCGAKWRKPKAGSH